MKFIELLKYLFLGFIQGITEPIPVSSSGHLLIFQNIINGLDTIDYGILATITNFGSLLAITLIFKNQIFLFPPATLWRDCFIFAAIDLFGEFDGEYC